MDLERKIDKGCRELELFQRKKYLQELVERRRTFSEAIDANKDGHADKREILTFLDPKHPFRSAEEAQRLINISDEDQVLFSLITRVILYFVLLSNFTFFCKKNQV